MEGQSFYPTAVDIRLWLRDRHTGDLTDFCWQPDGPVAGMLQCAAAEYAGKVASSAQGVAVLQFAGPQEALSAAKSLQEKLSASQEEKDGNVTAALFVSPWLDAGNSTEEQAAELRRTLDMLEPGHIAMSDEIYQIAKAMPFFESATEKVSSSGNGVSASIHELEFTTEVIPSAAEEASAPVQESAPTESNTAPATGAMPETSERPTSPGAAHHARYEIISKLGSGAMGVVYKAHDRMIGRTVALKTIRVDSQDMDRGELVQRLLQEAKAAGGLDHPNIITVYDVGEADN